MKNLILYGHVLMLLCVLCPFISVRADVYKNISWTTYEGSKWDQVQDQTAADGIRWYWNTTSSSTSFSQSKVLRCTFSGLSKITFEIDNSYTSSNSYSYYSIRYGGLDTKLTSTPGDYISRGQIVFSIPDAGTHYVEFVVYQSYDSSVTYSIKVSSVEIASVDITNEEGVDINYSFSNDQAIVNSANPGAERVVIPSTVSYQGRVYNVNHIGAKAFANSVTLTSVHIPASIQTIGANAFKNSPNLKKVIVEPNTVPAGFAQAFDKVADRMVYVGNHNYDDDVPALLGTGGTLNIYEYLSSSFTTEGVTYVYDPVRNMVDAIDCDYATQNVTVPSMVSYKAATIPVSKIKRHTFRNHDGLTQITVGGNVQEIENDAFAGCTALQTVNFESGNQPLAIQNIAPLFSTCPIITVNKSREITYTVSPFKDNKTITTVNVNGTAKTIKSDEFGGCTGLTTLTTTGALEEIGDNAFKGMNLTDITLDGNHLSIGSGAFMGCSQLAGVLLEPGVGNIGAQAFKNCNKIRSNLRIGQQNELTIGAEAFYGCSAITNINLGQGVTSIGPRAFYNCRLVPTFNLSEKITNIGSGAFANCESLARVVIPSKITQINDSTFLRCSAITSISIPSTVTTIGASAFEGTTSLSGIVLPESLTSLGNAAFKGSGITSAFIPDGVAMLPRDCFLSTGSLQTVDLNKVTSIGEQAFMNSGIVELTIHSCVASISDGAFRGCENLANLTIENGSRMLTLGKNCTGQGIFRDCLLTNTYVGRPLSHGSVSDDGFSPFYGNTKMQNVTLDGNYTAVPERMFGGCSNLNAVTLGPGVLTLSQYSFANSGLKSINIPSKIAYIPAHCFENATRLEAIVIPETVTRIDAYAFNGSGLVSANISGNVPTISERAFGNTHSLETITLNDGITEIAQYAFEGSALEEITIPRTINAIGIGAFNGCANLKDVTICDGASTLELGYNASGKGLFYDCRLENLYIGRNLRFSTSSSYGFSPFYRNTSIKKVTIGDIPTEVYIYMFQDCSALEEVEIGDGVTRISDYAFSGCANLAEFNVGAAIRSIGDEAFSDCGKMTTLKTYAKNPPVCGSNALSDINIFNCTLYIPFGSTADYKAADQWSRFFSITEFDAGVQVSYIEMSQSTATMKVGETLKIDATAYPEQALVKVLEWSSSNENVAIVDVAGNVTALRDGFADITASATDGSGVKAVCKITVIDESTPGSFRFEIPNIEAIVNNVTLLPVTMVNEGPVIGFQCDLLLPAGFTVARDEYGMVPVVASNRFVDHIVTDNDIDGVTRFIAVSMNNREFRGTDGVLFSIPIIATGNPREAEVTIRNIKLSKTGSIQEEVTPVSSTVKVLPAYRRGDANGDDQITVTDVTITISAALGEVLSGFNKVAADCDGNGEITVNDVTSIITLVLNQSGVKANALRAPRLQTDDMLRFDNIGFDGSCATFDVNLLDASDYIAAQLEVAIPEGFELAGISLNGSNADTHQAVYRMAEDNTLRVLVVSMTNANFSDDSLLSLQIVKNGDSMTDSYVCFGNSRVVEFSDDEMIEVSATGQSACVATPSGIFGMESDGVEIYVSGRTVNVVAANDTVITIADVMGRCQTVEVKAGTSAFDLPTAGVYFINNVKYFLK